MSTQENKRTEMDETLKKEIKELIITTIREENKSSNFATRKLTDTPTDALSVVNKRFVTLNGAVASRPVSSVATVGQHYFASDTNIPMVYSAGGWRNGVGSVVAQNN